MVEVTKPDYLSLVNKGGSGFNVSELVDSMVAAEIEPKRILQTTKQEKTENAISGIGFLNSQATTTKGNVTTLLSDQYFEVSSSNTSGVVVTSNDETKLENGIRTISNVEIAQKMVFEFSGFSDKTSPLTDGGVEIDFGTWSFIPATSSDPTATYSAGKTYEVITEIPVGSDVDDIISSTDWAGNNVTPIAVGATFTVSAALPADKFLAAGAYIKEIDSYAFEPNSDNSTQDFDFTGENLTQIAARFNAVNGISAQIVDTTGAGNSYSLVISGDATGIANGFRISDKSLNERWDTPLVTLGHQNGSGFTQFAKNATFTLDGVTISRSDNEIDDLIEGVDIELKSDFTSAASISFERSKSSVKQAVNDLIFTLNEFKNEIDRLTLIDLEEGNNGPLAMDPAAVKLKSNFKSLVISPLQGYGENPIYLSQLGIKTNSNGEYFVDEAIFEKTFSNNPEYFSAIKDDNIATSVPTITAGKSDWLNIPSGNYEVLKEGGKWKFGGSDLLEIDMGGGAYKYTSTTYPGLTINTISALADDFTYNVYVGVSLSKKISAMMDEIVAINSPISNSEESYKSVKVELEERLEKLELREELLKSRYTEQFGAMEQAMTQFNSTKSMLENFMESWKKQK